MRDPRQAVNSVRNAAEAAGWTATEYEGDRSVQLRLTRQTTEISVHFIVKNLATEYACFHHAGIRCAPDAEPDLCWAMRDLFPLLSVHAAEPIPNGAP